MNTQEFLKELEARVAKYDLLCHPFYKAWAAGELTANDLQEYGRDYYHHVNAFPTYLAEFGIRLDEGELRRAVLSNLSDEKGRRGFVRRAGDASLGALAGFRRRYRWTARDARP